MAEFVFILAIRSRLRKLYSFPDSNILSVPLICLYKTPFTSKTCLCTPPLTDHMSTTKSPIFPRISLPRKEVVKHSVDRCCATPGTKCNFSQADKGVHPSTYLSPLCTLTSIRRSRGSCAVSVSVPSGSRVSGFTDAKNFLSTYHVLKWSMTSYRSFMFKTLSEGGEDGAV